MGSLQFQIKTAQTVGSEGDPTNPYRFIRVSLNTHSRLQTIKEDLSVSKFHSLSFNEVIAELLDCYDSIHHDFEKKPL